VRKRTRETSAAASSSRLFRAPRLQPFHVHICEGSFMKSIAFVALSALATAAMALGPTPDPEILISGSSVQTVSLTGAMVSNTANANTEARQNLASNAGKVTISGASNQAVNAGALSFITNVAMGDDAYASQNLSSNIGNVTVSGSSTQLTSLAMSSVVNKADGKDSVAVQNLATNNSCYSCQKATSPWPF
jgi:hypothetical protein